MVKLIVFKTIANQLFTVTCLSAYSINLPAKVPPVPVPNVTASTLPAKMYKKLEYISQSFKIKTSCSHIGDVVQLVFASLCLFINMGRSLKLGAIFLTWKPKVILSPK